MQLTIPLRLSPHLHCPALPGTCHRGHLTVLCSMVLSLEAGKKHTSINNTRHSLNFKLLSEEALTLDKAIFQKLLGKCLLLAIAAIIFMMNI